MKLFSGVFLAAAVAASTAQAGNFSFTGQFSTDDQIQLINLSLGSAATVTFQSYGYGGGTNAAGTPIPAGGFDSFFTWFDSTGTQIGTNDDGCGAAHMNNGVCLDAYASVFLTAGSYTLALTQSPNEPIGNLSDGFLFQGAGDFTANGTCTAFCDVFGNTDNGNWAVDILNVDSASIPSGVPEPATFLMAGSALLLLVQATRRRIG